MSVTKRLSLTDGTNSKTKIAAYYVQLFLNEKPIHLSANSILALNALCDFANDAPVHNNGIKRGEDGASDEAIEVAEIV